MNYTTKILFTTALLVSAYIISVGMMALSYERLLFHPSSTPDRREEELLNEHPEVEKAVFETYDGRELHGWIVHKDDEEATLYFGGNAEEVSWMVENHRKLGNSSQVFVNYRGFGDSEGRPRIKRLKNDSITVHDELKEKHGFRRFNVIGRSIGTGFAVHLADNREEDVERAVLVSPFSSLNDIVSSNILLRPGAFLIQDRFQMVEKAERQEIPLLMVTGEDDSIIPEKLSEEFYDKWRGEKRKISIPGRGHNDLHLNDTYWDSISEFLDSKD